MANVRQMIMSVWARLCLLTSPLHTNRCVCCPRSSMQTRSHIQIYSLKSTDCSSEANVYARVFAHLCFVSVLACIDVVEHSKMLACFQQPRHTKLSFMAMAKYKVGTGIFTEPSSRRQRHISSAAGIPLFVLWHRLCKNRCMYIFDSIKLS